MWGVPLGKALWGWGVGGDSGGFGLVDGQVAEAAELSGGGWVGGEPPAWVDGAEPPRRVGSRGRGVESRFPLIFFDVLRFSMMFIDLLVILKDFLRISWDCCDFL